MEEQLITFETAKLAKEKEFNIPVISYYTPKGYCTESEGYKTERLEESNWNNGMGSYPTLSKDVSCSAPTQSLLQKWLREVHNITIFMTFKPNIKKWDFIPYSMDMNAKEYIKYNWEYTKIHNERRFDTYEEALEEGLQEALKLIQK
jgi:hypothetical protein